MSGAGSFGTRRTRIRRLAGVLLLALFVLANPAWFCSLDCLIHDHGGHGGRRHAARADGGPPTARAVEAAHHDGGAAMGDGCQPSGARIAPLESVPDRELSPHVPALASARPAVVAGRAGHASGPGHPVPTSPSPPPIPPPRA